MGKLRPGHLVEAALWLIFALFLFIYSFEFDRNIEIYRYGASTWPRAIILLIVIGALGQLFYQWRYGDESGSSMIGTASDDGAEQAAQQAHHTSISWYASTLFILAIPFLYMRLPKWIADINGLDKDALGTVKLVTAAVCLVLYLGMLRRNPLGAMLALPIFFAAMLTDMGFYALAPLFIIGVMFLMGERRINRMAAICALIYGVILFLFLSLLYVGLPTGNIHPFYDFGNWMVNLLQ